MFTLNKQLMMMFIIRDRQRYSLFQPLQIHFSTTGHFKTRLCRLFSCKTTVSNGLKKLYRIQTINKEKSGCNEARKLLDPMEELCGDEDKFSSEQRDLPADYTPIFRIPYVVHRPIVTTPRM